MKILNILIKVTPLYLSTIVAAILRSGFNPTEQDSNIANSPFCNTWLMRSMFGCGVAGLFIVIKFEYLESIFINRILLVLSP